MRRRAMVTMALAAAVLVGGTSACRGDDRDRDRAEADEIDLVAYCEAALALETAPPPDFGTTTAIDEIEELVRTYARGTLEPLAETAADRAPREVGESVDVVESAVGKVADSGKFDELESEAFGDAIQTMHDYDVGACAWQKIDVTMSEYAFGGIPATVPSGPTTIELTNTGTEYHELVLAKKNAGTTQTAAELVALPDDEALNLVTFVNQGDAEPGESGYLVADLDPGTYVVACFVPVGTETSTDDPPADPEPHTSRGMVAEFTVG